MIYVGLDVSLNSVAICAVDETGRLFQEGTTSADAPSILRYLAPSTGQVERVGLEAGPTSEWLTANLIALGLPAVSLEARQVKAALSAMPVKTDRNDARGIAQLVRTGWFKPVHIKSIGSQRARTLAAARKHVIRSIAAAEQVIRGLLRPLGLKVGTVSRNLFATRVRELVTNDVILQMIIDPLIAARGALMREYLRLHRLVLKTVRSDPACRLLMTMPGIGPVSALTFRSTIDDPRRFVHSQSVGAYLGLTPRRYQSGEIDRIGRITKVGDPETRTALFEAANVVLRPSTRWSPMKAWAVRVAHRQGSKRAKVALARKMAVVLHRMWVDRTEFRWTAAA
ncbi:IS110 family RNA-guided transposase [Bradyrhizobium sp. USDA 10063]